jgi:ABC-type transport system involved in cytochrome bd biosynthesis fused ATPase/permease subunit
MKKRLLPTILLLVVAMFVGFSLLAHLYRPHAALVITLAVVLLLIASLLVRYAVIFDRQMREVRERAEQKE